MVQSITRRDSIILAIIVLIAALMRFGQAGIVEFFHDDAMLASMAQEIAQGEAFYFTGINSSVGIPNPPTSVYAMVLPFALNLNPTLAIWVIMGWNVIGVALLWLLVHRYIGRTVALVAGLSYAVSPWAVLFSRKIWAQDYHTPFVLLALLLALYGFWEDRQQKSQIWAQIAALPILLFGLQIHFAAWALLPLYFVIIMTKRRNIAWWALGVSIILSALVMLPYVIGLSQALQTDPNRVSAAAERSDITESFALSDDSIESLFYLATGLGMEQWIAPSQQAEMRAAVPPVALWLISGALVIIGAGLLFRERLRQFALLILTWAFLPAVLLIPNWADVYGHYFIASIPALMLLIAIAVTWISQIVPVQPYGRSIILVAYVGILLTQAVYFRGMLRFVDETEIEYPGFTIPLHYLNTIEAELSTYDDVVILSDGMAWDLNHESVVWDVLLRDTATCVRTLRGDGYAVFPAGEFAALQAPNMPIDGIGQLYLRDDASIYEARSAEETYRVHAWESVPQWTGVTVQAIDPVLFDSDVQLTGYSLENNLLTLEWQLPARTPHLDYQFSGQLLDADGARLLQRDKRFWHGRHWCEGDRLLTWVSVEIPDDVAELRVSLYQLGGANEAPFINANVLDVMGNPQGQYVSIPINAAP